MFKAFQARYSSDPGAAGPGTQLPRNDSRAPWSQARGFEEFIGSLAFSSYQDGLLRFFLEPRLSQYNGADGLLSDWPEYRKRLYTFGCDWLGRQFCLDIERKEHGEQLVSILEPGTGELLEPPYAFSDFINVGLVEDADAALAIHFFEQWRRKTRTRLQPGQCAGYIKPLFLGGADDIENLEVNDIDVYVSLCGQLFAAVRKSKSGRIGGFSIS